MGRLQHANVPLSAIYNRALGVCLVSYDVREMSAHSSGTMEHLLGWWQNWNGHCLRGILHVNMRPAEGSGMVGLKQKATNKDKTRD